MESKTKAYIALGLVCFIWGTTYLAVRIGVAHFPGLLFMAIRNILAGSLLLVGLRILKKEKQVTWANIKLQIVPGLCMITFGIGMVGWAVRYIPSGLAALICAMIPIFTIIVNLIFDRNEQINKHIALGVLLGMCGLAIVFGDNLALVRDTNSFIGILLTAISCVFWAFGGLYTQFNKSTSSPFFNAGVQLLTGGIGLTILSFFAEDWQGLTFPETTSILALLYLVFVGSILAFCSYLYAMSELPAGLVSIYAYINPLVAIVLGYIILHETITVFTILAFVITMIGVYLVNLGYRIKNLKTASFSTGKENA